MKRFLLSILAVIFALGVSPSVVLADGCENNPDLFIASAAGSFGSEETPAGAATSGAASVGESTVNQGPCLDLFVQQDDGGVVATASDMSGNSGQIGGEDNIQVQGDVLFNSVKQTGIVGIGNVANTAVHGNLLVVGGIYDNLSPEANAGAAAISGAGAQAGSLGIGYGGEAGAYNLIYNTTTNLNQNTNQNNTVIGTE